MAKQLELCFFLVICFYYQPEVVHETDIQVMSSNDHAVEKTKHQAGKRPASSAANLLGPATRRQLTVFEEIPACSGPPGSVPRWELESQWYDLKSTEVK